MQLFKKTNKNSTEEKMLKRKKMDFNHKKEGFEKLSKPLKMVPVSRLELPTHALRMRCSTN